MKSSLFTQFDCAMAPGMHKKFRMLGFIDRRDQRLMRRVNGWYAPRWVRLWMMAATRAGDGWLWYTIGILILLFGGEERWRAIAAAVLAEGAGITLLLRIKKARQPAFTFISDNQDISRLPAWVKTARQTTDGHLAGAGAPAGT